MRDYQKFWKNYLPKFHKNIKKRNLTKNILTGYSLKNTSFFSCNSYHNTQPILCHYYVHVNAIHVTQLGARFVIFRTIIRVQHILCPRSMVSFIIIRERGVHSVSGVEVHDTINMSITSKLRAEMEKIVLLKTIYC